MALYVCWCADLQPNFVLRVETTLKNSFALCFVRFGGISQYQRIKTRSMSAWVPLKYYQRRFCTACMQTVMMQTVGKESGLVQREFSFGLALLYEQFTSS